MGATLQVPVINGAYWAPKNGPKYMDFPGVITSTSVEVMGLPPPHLEVVGRGPADMEYLPTFTIHVFANWQVRSTYSSPLQHIMGIRDIIKQETPQIFKF